MAERAGPPLCLALDVGGSKIEAGVVDENGRVLQRARVGTPKDLDEEGLFALVASVLEGALHAAPCHGRLAALGIGCGGPMEDELVSPLNIPAWRAFPLVERVRKLPLVAEAGIPVALENDAKALALGEGWRGAAVGADDFIAMVVSTGIGGGIVSGGRLLDGAMGNAGHIGHVVVEPEGRPCVCGGRGCLEAEASGTAIAALTGKPPATAPLELKERAGTLVGRAVASVANLLDLPLALVAGSVALGFGTPFFAAAARELSERARLSFSSSARIERAGLGPDGPLVGAAAVGWRALGHPVVGGA